MSINRKIKSTQNGEWNIVDLGYCTDIISGQYYPYSDFCEHGIKCLKIDNVGYGNITWENTTYLPSNYIQLYPDLSLKTGDIVIALNRPITNGNLKIAKIKDMDIPSILYQRVGKLIINESVIDANYAFQLFRSEIFKKEVIKILVGSDQPYIRIPSLLLQKVSIPPLFEQYKITAILTSVDALIEITENIIIKTEMIKKGIMQNLFSIKEIKSWNKSKFKKIVLKLKRGYSLATNNEDRGVRYLTSGNLSDDSIDWSGMKYLDTDKSLENCLLKQNDLIINCVNSYDKIGKVAIFEGFKEPVVVGFNNFGLEFKEEVNSKFIKYFCMRAEFQSKLKQSSKPAVQQVSFSGKDLLEIEIYYPDIIQQNKIVAILSNVDERLKLEYEKKQKLLLLKKGLMQVLLTGKIRVRVDNV